MDSEEKSSWDGLKLAKEAVPDQDLEKVPDSIEADDEESESECEDDDDDDDSEDFDVHFSPSDERLLEELLRMKLTSLPSDTSASSILPVSRNRGGGVNLFKPKSRLEQFEDILIESQLLEAALPELEVAAAVAASGNGFESVGFDFDASDAIFNDDIVDDEDNDATNPECDCSTCRERLRHKDELQRLKQTWSDVKEAVALVYDFFLSDNYSSNPPDVIDLRELVRELLWRDPHQLFQRLEMIVRESVLEQKVKLIKLLKSQAKNPSLAQEFIQKLLDGYDRLCNACQHLSPVLLELESEHLSRFSLSWEILNKYLHQSIIYSDPIIQNNVPIFISQLRSLYSDKEHEGKYTELVRGFLDFDVEMSNVVSFWSNSEKLLAEYNNQQIQLRAKQKMLKEDWERFKAQRRDLKIQMDKDHQQCSSSSLIEGIKRCPNFGSNCDCEFCSLHVLKEKSNNCAQECKAKCVNGSSKVTSSPSSSKLAEIFPSVLTAEGKKTPQPKEESTTKSENTTEPPPKDNLDHQVDRVSEGLEQVTLKPNNAKPEKKAATAQPPPGKKATTAKELRDLMYQHYCVGKGRLKKPSANAIKKGKFPPPPCSTLHKHAEGSDELSDNDDDDDDDDDNSDTCSSSETSKATTTTASESQHNKNAAHCNCCYCEVFGPGGQTVAPVSRNYPEMRERLRLILSKKKRKQNNQNCHNNKVNAPPPPPPPHVPPPQQQPPPAAKLVSSQQSLRASSASSSASSNLRSRSSRSIESKKSSISNQGQHAGLVKDEKSLDELLDFIEGNRKLSSNEKKRAKKERQKQQKMEEIRIREEEERRIREAEEAHRKRIEEEARKAQEMEKREAKKRKKKEAQRLKKMATKGELPPTSEPQMPQQAPVKDSEAALEELRAKHMRELQELQLQHQRQLEEEARKLRLKTAPNRPSTSSNPPKRVAEERPSAPQQQPGTQIKITRTPSGGVEFTTVPAASSSSSSRPQSFMEQPSRSLPSQPFLEKEPLRPSVPSKSGAPMVTIRRIEAPGMPEPMVTISMPAKEAGNRSKEDKLLYTLVNGQALRTPDAPSDLLPNAKLVEGLSKKQKKKMKKQAAQAVQPPAFQEPVNNQVLQQASPPMLPSQVPRNPLNQIQSRPPLPLDTAGRVDLERLQLPPGISITRIAGPSSERKYFPASPSEYGSLDQTVLPLPGVLNPSPMQQQPIPTANVSVRPVAQNANSVMDYSAMEGLPPGLNGPNVIVVDTSSLKTREEEEKDKKSKKKKKKAKAKAENGLDVGITKSATIGAMPPYMTPNDGPSMQPQVPQAASSSANSLKSGPQVLIKNINGRVTITPVPGTGATPVDTAEFLKKAANGHAAPKKQPAVGNPQVNGKRSPPQTRQVSHLRSLESSVVQKSHSVPNVNGHFQQDIHNVVTSNGDEKKNGKVKDRRKYSFSAPDGDDPDKVFAPSNDIDMDKADDSDRVVEQYKRFLAGFPSPTDQPRVRPKVELDLKNIFKKKLASPTSSSSVEGSNTNNHGTLVAPTVTSSS